MEITDKAADLAQQAGDKISKVTETINDKGNQLKKVEQRVMEDCCNYIADKPMTSMGLAVAGGFLLSRVLSAR